jgi:hypothetical protein
VWQSLTHDRIGHSMTSYSFIPQRSLRATKQILRRREKDRIKKKVQAITERPYRPGYDFRCLFCPRMFHRAGLIDHL